MFLKGGIPVLLRGAAIGALLVVSACNKDPATKASGSQVVARVNGVEVTYTELTSEIESNLKPGMVADEAQRAQFLDQIVRRKLLMEAARTQRIDKSPEYLSRIQRQDELTLASMLVANWEKEIDPPSEDAIKNYIAANPDKFANRKAIVIDRLSTATDKLPIDMDVLQELPTIKALAEMLGAERVQTNVERLSIDSAQAQGVLLQQIRDAKVGKPMLEVQGGKLLAVQVLEIRPIPVPPAQWRELAARAIHSEQISKIVEDRLKAQIAKAKIVYSEGYSAPKPVPTPAAAAPAKAAPAAPATPKP